MKWLTKALMLTMLLIGTAYAAVDINTATQSELEGVKGLGPSKAKAIIAYREKHGPFKSIDELDSVKGFGKASIDKLRSELTVGKSDSGKSTAGAAKKQ